MERTLPRIRPVKPPTPKTQLKKHVNSVFDELELVKKMTIKSKSPTEKTKQEPRKMMQACNGLSSLRMIQSSYSARAPLDSTAIDPMTRSPNYHHETGKIENLSRENLCLAYGPLELDDDDLDSLKLDHLS